MRSAVDLIERPFAFTQLDLLSPRAFTAAARVRDIRLSTAQLEGLHRLGLLRPLLRIKRDRRAIVREHVRSPTVAYQLAHWEGTQSWSLGQAQRRGLVRDVSDERFVPWRRHARTIGTFEYDASYFAYSQHQLMLLPHVAEALSHMVFDDDRAVTGLAVNSLWTEITRQNVDVVNDIVVAVSALEARYHPQITRRLRLSGADEFAAYDRWREQERLGSALRWLGLRPAWLRDNAAHLLREADRLDPLGDWFELIREADPESWTMLTGRARSAIDFRIAAEILLRYYEDLAQGNRTSPLPPPEKARFAHDEFEHRLRPKGGLDSTLTRFGLSPHPSLLLVLEGATELLLFPRVMALVGLRLDEDFISVQDAEGVTKSIAPLVAYAIAPRGVLEGQGRYLVPSKPLAKLLCVMDAEGPMATARLREKRRRTWVERLLRTLPATQRTREVESTIDDLVHADVWNKRGESFEFAHFTDRQLATAIDRLDDRPQKPDLERLVRIIKEMRAKQGNLERLLYRTSKPELADDLWPTLEAKILRATERGTEARIPIIRVLDHATDLARQLPRRNVVIPLHE